MSLDAAAAVAASAVDGGRAPFEDPTTVSGALAVFEPQLAMPSVAVAVTSSTENPAMAPRLRLRGGEATFGTGVNASAPKGPHPALRTRA